MTRRAAVVALALVACDPPDRGPKWRPAGATTPRDGGTLRIAVAEAVGTLDPSFAYDEFSYYVVHALFDTLLDYAPGSLTLEPRLAERWERSADGLTYTFWLRPGITYSDGQAIVAGDVAYSLERALTTAGSPFGPLLGDVAGASEVLAGTATHCVGITAPSDHELVIRLSQPNAAFPYLMTMPFSTPQRAAHVAAVGDELRRRPLGSGPFVLERWDEGSEIVIRKNPRYHTPSRVHVDAVVTYERRSSDAQFLLFEAGEVDVAYLAAADYLWLVEQPAWAPYLQAVPSLFTFGTRLNVRKKPLDDRRVRQALNYAYDKQHSIKLRQGRAVAAHGILPPGLLGRDDTLAPYPYDPARARALLAEAGYPDGLELEYVGVPAPELEPLATALEADLARVGVRLRRSAMSLGALQAAAGQPDGPAMSWTSWLADYPDATNFLDVRFHSRMITDQASTNDSFYANPELDALLDRARGESDPTTRAALYRRAERILYDDAPWIWDYHGMASQVVQPYVRGLDLHPVWTRVYADAWLDLGPDGRPVPR